jgi:cellulose synthase/poly-beta-1,6-N-acetylglucosamine synthase-like glycosyltransferase
MGKNWLSTVVSVYEETGHKMISSPVAYFNEKTIFERAQTLEFAYLIGLGAASIANQSAGTCNGANLAYQKAAFFSVDGFKGIDQLASGDDELLMHKIAAKYPGQLSFLKNTDAIVYTYAKPNLSEFITQRRRWASKSTQYKAKGMMYMAIFVWIFNLSIALNLLVAIFTGQYLPLVFQLVSKLLIEFSFVSVVMSFFRRRKLLYLLPLLTLVHTPYIIYIGIMGNSGKYNWKGRQVR